MRSKEEVKPSYRLVERQKLSNKIREQKGNDPAQVYLSGVITPAMTYFPAMQYHRRLGLNCCVRDGNRCDTKALITDKQPTASFDGADADSRNQKVKPGAERTRIDD